MVSVAKKDQYIWCCKRAGHGRVSETIRAGSLFEKSKSSLFSWVKYIYSMHEDDLEIPGEGRNGSLE
ncbi:hypothetical protein AOLI_G00170600 [Acnodon oligacanthus]